MEAQTGTGHKSGLGAVGDAFRREAMVRVGQGFREADFFQADASGVSSAAEAAEIDDYTLNDLFADNIFYGYVDPNTNFTMTDIIVYFTALLNNPNSILLSILFSLLLYPVYLYYIVYFYTQFIHTI